MTPRTAAAAFLLLLAAAAAPAQEAEPLLRVEAGGPTSFVTALAFSPDGKTLYAAGWDKVVRVWTRDAQGRFVPERRAYRVPLGPGLEGGSINAVALSADGAWLAVGGSMWSAGRAGFRDPGWIVPVAALDEQALKDQGTIYVFSTRDAAAPVRQLRGHTGPVLALAFAAPRKDKLPPLASAAEEWDRKAGAYAAGAARLWDLDKGTSESCVLPKRVTRPALAAWSTPEGKPRVAVAWGDKLFRVWDGEAGKAPREFANGDNNAIAAVLPDRDRPALLAGSWVPPGGRLDRWELPPDGKAPRVQPVASFPPLDGTHRTPWALALVSAGGDGSLDHAAVVLQQVNARGKEYWLHLVELRSGESKARLRLWQVGGGLPVLAAAPQGRHLAVAGNADHDVFIFAIADLLKGKNEFPAPLRSAGATVRRVAFVKKGDELGLALGEKGAAWDEPPRPPQAGESVFGFTARRLTGDADGWQPAFPKTAGWTAKLEKGAGGRPVVALRQDGKAVGQVPLKEGQAVTAFAVLPPPAFAAPLVALALEDDQRQPSLGLYDGRSGEQVRQLTGHLDTIRSLCFAADGRLLASAAEDQTVCVWSLTDLGQLLGQRGLLRGVAVEDGPAGKVVVARIDDDEIDPKNRDLLKKGDVLEGLRQGDKLQPLASARDFYAAVSWVKPGKVRLKRPGGEVEVVLGQGLDERKPLLSLFLTHGERPEARKWVGWSPNGFFEAADRDAEAYLGWHTNTGRAERPTTFAEAKEYRERFHKPGLLKTLVAHADLGRALQELDRPAPLPRPRMLLWLDGASDPEQGDEQKPLLVRQRGTALKLAVAGFPLDRVARVEWQWGDGAAQEMQAATGGVWSADLAAAAWRRGEQKVRAVLTTQEAPPRQHTQELTLRFQPPPPAVKLAAGPRLAVDRPDFTFEAEVRPGDSEEVVVVRVRHDGKDALKQPLKAKEVVPLKQPVTLHPGENRFQVVAVNRDALKGYEDSETSERTLLVTYNPPKEDPLPVIALEALVPQLGDGKDGSPLPVEPGKPLVVDVPQVRVRGKISAEGALVKAESARADKFSPLADFAAGKAKEFEVKEVLPLTPGRQEFRFRAKTAASKEAEAVLAVEYRPALPAVAQLTADSPEVLYGDGARQVALTGRLGPLPNSQEFAAALLLNGKPTPVKVAIDVQARTLTAAVAVADLAVGDNRVQLRLTNAWDTAAVSGEAVVRYVPAPRDVRFDKPEVAAKPVADLTARVRSPLPLLADAAIVEVNGRQVRTVQVEAAPDADRPEEHVVRLRGVPLEVGDNTVSLWVVNREAAARGPGTVTIRFEPPKPPPPPPEVRALDPQRDLTWNLPQYAFAFQVTSPEPLQRVELRRGPDVLLRVDVADVAKNASGFYEVRRTETVKLTPGANDVQVVAANAGGERSAGRVLTYVERPVWLEGVRLEAQGQLLEPDGDRHFPAAPGPRLWLHGRVAWLDGNAPQLGDPKLRVRVWVNGAPQALATLAPRQSDAAARTFRAPVVLDRAKNNFVEVQLPDLKAEASSDGRFLVDCNKPDDRPPQLHLLIVALGEEDKKALTAQVFQALQAEFVKEDEGLFKTPAFPVARLYACLTGQVSHGRVLRQLNRLQTDLARRARDGAVHDVVMVYYQGKETGGPQGYFLQTGDTLPLGQDYLEQFFAEVPGAPIFLLDVAAPGAAARWPGDSRIGVLRSARLDDAAGDDARLLAALKEALPQASKLGEVDERVGARFKQVKLAVYAPHLPDGSRDQVIGRKP